MHERLGGDQHRERDEEACLDVEIQHERNARSVEGFAVTQRQQQQRQPRDEDNGHQASLDSFDRWIEQARPLIESVEWAADRQRKTLEAIGFSP